MTVKGTPHTTHSSGTEHTSTGGSHESGGTKRSEPDKTTTTNGDGSEVQRDSHGNVDNDKNAKKDKDGKFTGDGIDVNAPPPKDQDALQAYRDKKALIAEGKAAGMTAKQELNATLAEIKQWAKDHENDGDRI